MFDKSDVHGLSDLISVLLMPTYVAIHVIVGYTSLTLKLVILAVFATTLQVLVSPSKFSHTKLLLIMVVDSFEKVIKGICEDAGLSQASGYDNALSFLILSYLTENLVVSIMEAHKPKESEEQDELYQRLEDEENQEAPRVEGEFKKTIKRLLDVVDMSLITFVIALILSCIGPVRLALTTDAKILNETVFASTKLMSSTVKIVSIFVFGAHLFLYEIEIFDSSRVMYLFTNIVKTLAITLVGSYVVFHILFKVYGYISDPIVALMLLFLFAEPIALGHIAILDEGEEDSDSEKKSKKTHVLQYVVGLLAFTISNTYFLYLLTSHYAGGAVDGDVAGET